MDIHLSLYETRVIGSLMEKEITTPDQYPLSLNALINACDQKSNRDPVLELDEATVQETIDGLVKKHLLSGKTGFGSRVTKYHHRFCNTEFGNLRFSPQEFGIVCLLLLRGSQTPGELRTRTQRLCEFADVPQVEATLRALAEREDGPFVTRLPREGGKREARYAHLFSGDVQVPDAPEGPDVVVRHASPGADRLERLELQVEEMRAEIEQLKRDLKSLSLD